MGGKYDIWCAEPPAPTPGHFPKVSRYWGSCGSKEFCVKQLTRSVELGMVAWCAPATCFVRLVTTLLPLLPHTPQGIKIPSRDVGVQTDGSYGEIGFALTEPTNASAPYQASSISIQARDTQERPLSHAISCSECSSLSYAESPDGTASFSVSVKVRFFDDEPDLNVINWMTGLDRE